MVKREENSHHIVGSFENIPMKHSIIVTRLMDSLQGHRFVEPVLFSEIGKCSFTVLSTWRFMWRRRVLVVLEIPSGTSRIADIASLQRRIRHHVRRQCGLLGWWRPQSWQWLVIVPRIPDTMIGAAASSLHEPLMIYALDSDLPQILRSGGADEGRVRDILKRR